jgi:hypothetical protein
MFTREMQILQLHLCCIVNKEKVRDVLCSLLHIHIRTGE